MKGEPASYRRRDDGILEIARGAGRRSGAVRGAETAIAAFALVVGATAAISGNRLLAIILISAAVALVASRLVRDRLATRAGRRLQSRAALTPSDDRVGLRVIRLEERASAPARVPETAVRLPGTAASPQE